MTVDPGLAEEVHGEPAPAADTRAPRSCPAPTGFTGRANGTTGAFVDVAATFGFVLVFVLVYVAIIAAKLTRLQRETAELVELARRKTGEGSWVGTCSTSKQQQAATAPTPSLPRARSSAFRAACATTSSEATPSRSNGGYAVTCRASFTREWP